MSEEKKKEKDIITIIENYYKSMTKEDIRKQLEHIAEMERKGYTSVYCDY